MSDTALTYAVIGSGPAGVMAASTLLERGLRVTMIDVGVEGQNLATPPEGSSFRQLQESNKDQGLWLLGKEFEALHIGAVGTGSHLSAQRLHVREGASDWAPLEPGNFSPLESFARGGLGVAWGLGAYVYNADELKQAGLDPDEMGSAYQVIADRIGISCGNDDMRQELAGDLKGLQDPVRMDKLNSRVYSNYLKRRGWFRKQGISMGHASLALLTAPFEGRPATGYDELEFYREDPAAWRPELTLEELELNPDFNYRPGLLVLDFREGEEDISIRCLETSSGATRVLLAERLILACGPLASARIVMRSLGLSETPFRCNPYAYIASFFPPMLGRNPEEPRSALAQSMMHILNSRDEARNLMVSHYSYRSLLLYRLLELVPYVPFREAVRLVRYLSPALLLSGVHFPDPGNTSLGLRLVPDDESLSGDRLVAENEPVVIDGWKDELKLLRKALMKMGCIPIRTMVPEFGSSIHYSGTLPFSEQEEKGKQNPDGLLYGTKNVYIADASGFRELPAKGITLSLMANAHRIATKIDADE